MNRKEMAVMLHGKGFNCAQSVACAFCHVMGADPEQVFKHAEAFGFGMGTMGTCGAVSAMALVTGMKLSDGNMDDPKTKRQCYDMMKTLTGEFEKKNSSIICSQLKGVDTGTPLRSCNGCIEDAVELLDKYLLEQKSKTDIKETPLPWNSPVRGVCHRASAFKSYRYDIYSF